MYPDPNQNQTPDQPQYSIDYLNQIAPESKKPGLSNRLFLILVGGGLVLAAIVGFFVLSSGSMGPTQKMQMLAARLETLRGIADASQKNLKSNDLRGANSSLTVFLTNANRDIAEPLMNSGVDIKKLDKNIVAEETGVDVTKKLEDARLNAVFDRVYAREMGYQLDTVAALMKEIYFGSKSESLKKFLEDTDSNLLPIKKQLYDFNTAAN